MYLYVYKIMLQLIFFKLNVIFCVILYYILIIAFFILFSKICNYTVLRERKIA